MTSRLACTLLISSLLCRVAPADINSPDGLSAGDPYRIAFVTSGVRDATSDDISVYNAFVNNAANTPGTLTVGLGSTWAAIASVAGPFGPGTDARDNTSTNPNVNVGVPIFLADGTKLAEDNADLWDGSILTRLTLDEYGVAHHTEWDTGHTSMSQKVWTGTDVTGVASGPIGSVIVRVGSTGDTDGGWIHGGGTSTTIAQFHLYGISDELTAVPEPSAFLYGRIILAAAVAGRFVKRKRGLAEPSQV